MTTRPTAEDLDALDLLLLVDILDEQSAQFVEGLNERGNRAWSAKQCAWFDRLCERYL